MSGLKENNMSNGEVLAAVNKISYKKIQNPTNSQIFQATPYGSYTHFWYSKVELDQKETRWKDASLGSDSEKWQNLGSLRKVQLKIERDYGRNFFCEQPLDWVRSNFCLTLYLITLRT
jgi:hypothetical protein